MREAFDSAWYERLRSESEQLDETQWFDDHMRIGHEEREQFLDNEIENPRFTYRPGSPMQDAAERLETFLSDIEKSSSNAIVAELYDRKVRKQIDRTRLLQASRAGDDQAMYEASVDLYGAPTKKLFSYVAKRVKEMCANVSGADEERHRLHRVVAKIATDQVDVSAGILPPVVTTGKPVSDIQTAVTIFTDTLERYEISGWNVVVDETGRRSRFSVNRLQQTVYVPNLAHLQARPQALTDVQLEALAEHEIGVHVRRSYAGSQSSLHLLAIGLDSYLVGEEGLAGYVQQQIEGATEFYGFDRYFASGLAVGLDGRPRDFRSVFAIMCDFYTVQARARGQEPKRVTRAAWEVCVRIFRGTTGQTPGCIYTKDTVYMQGNIGIWELLTEQPEIFPHLFVGKFNPLLSRHIRSLQTLEIMP